MEGSRAQSFEINNEKLRSVQEGKQVPSSTPVLVDYFGHSCVRIVSPLGLSVLIDPWRNDPAWGWWFPVDFPEVKVDIALSTHAHFDHAALHIPKALITMERMVGTYTLGDIRITGSAVLLPCEEVRNDTRDTFVLSGKSRSVIRGIGRETLKPLQKEVSPMKTKTLKKRGVER